MAMALNHRLNQLKDILNQELHAVLTAHTPTHSFAQVYDYAVMPAGKLFRPLLVLCQTLDLNPELTPDQLLKHNAFWPALASEIHHAYTLVHDDLPCMDDDEYRRGKLTVHRQFGQWQAVLAGDGLLNLSYLMLSHIKGPQLAGVLRLFAWATGPKGLIQGQVLDLSGEMTESRQQLLQTHYLKTGKLFQACLGSGYLLSGRTLQTRELYRYLKMGKSLGIVFQLMDDLDELCEATLSAHELAVNPWPTMGPQMLEDFKRHLNQLQISLQRHPGTHLRQLLGPFLHKWASNKLNTQAKNHLLANLKGNKQLFGEIEGLATDLVAIYQA